MTNDNVRASAEGCARSNPLTLPRRPRRGKVSGLDLAQLPKRSANLFHLRAGNVVKFVMYLDGDRALADLGLASDRGSPDS
jgi:hypothetical protein